MARKAGPLASKASAFTSFATAAFSLRARARMAENGFWVSRSCPFPSVGPLLRWPRRELPTPSRGEAFLASSYELAQVKLFAEERR